nr:glutathione-disulfide reductase [Gynuella sunshinyii]
MAMFDYDLLVLGAGSGGVRAARFAAGFGAKVGIIEELYLGGTCVNVGCVPKKLFVYGSELRSSFKLMKSYGLNVSEPDFDWPMLRDNKTREISRLNEIYNAMLTNAGVNIIHGRGVLKDRHHIQVGDDVYSARNILIAVGGWPFLPDIPGREHLISSNEVFYLDEFPKDIVIIGGGYIAVEFAGIFAALGANVQLHYRGPQILRGFDDEVREFAADQIAGNGVDIRCQSNLTKVEKTDNKRLKVTFSSEAEERVWECDQVLMATGRKPKTTDLGLEGVGVELDSSGAIKVDEHFRTSVDNIYALGDVIDRVALTPVALAEGMFVARHLFDDKTATAVDYSNIPTAVFSQPNIGTVGLTEEQAKLMHKRVLVYTSNFRPMKYTLSDKQERCFMKLLVCGQTDKILGAHMVGPDAGEIIQGIAIAIKAGATKKDFDQTIGIHPTSAEEFVTMRAPSRIHEE